MIRHLNISPHEILDLIVCANDFGYSAPFLFSSLSEMLDKQLSDEEIDAYVKTYEEDSSYGEEDYKEIKKTLLNFRNEYILNIN